MNNLLSHLAARSFEAPLTLRPRVRSIFEPLHNRNASSSPLRAEDEQRKPSLQNESLEEQPEFAAFTEQDEARTQRARQSTQRNSATRRIESRARESAPGNAEKHAVEERTVSATDLQASKPCGEAGTVDSPRPPLAPLKLEPALQFGLHPTLAREAVTEPGHAMRKPASASARESDPQDDARLPRPAAIKPSLESRQRSAASAFANQDERDTDLRQIQPQSRASLLPSASIVDRGSKLDTGLMPRREEKQPLASTHPAPPVERSIHVTIGRIDIVAEMPQAPQRRSAEKNHAGITLEEYLRRRHARGTQ